MFFKARSESPEVSTKLCKQANGGGKVCCMCERDVEEMIQNFLDCPKYKRDKGEGRSSHRGGRSRKVKYPEGNKKMVLEFLPWLSILDAWNRRTIDSAKKTAWVIRTV